MTRRTLADALQAASHDEGLKITETGLSISRHRRSPIGYAAMTAASAAQAWLQRLLPL